MPRKVFVMLFLVLCVMTLGSRLCDAQVTFSRDWNAGKRANSASDAALDCSAKPVMKAYYMLTNGLRHLVACEANLMRKALQSDDIDNPEAAFNAGR